MRRFVHRVLRRTRGGHLQIAEGKRSYEFGDPEAELRAQVEIHSTRAYRNVLRGSTGLGEAYVDGRWTSDDPVAVVRLACRNLAPFDRLGARLRPIKGPLTQLARWVPANTRERARRHIAAHYDLGNRLFEAFLDERMVYSCAYYERPDVSLEEAQLAKLERICERLELTHDDHLVEIGTGWGGLAIHAAATRGCRVTTTTISREQHAHATRRVAEEGLADRVEVLFRDYRDLHARYDKLVSIEMIEAVGWQYFPVFFSKCAQLLRDGGLMFLQAIACPDHLYEQQKTARTFANKHVFPGGCLPSQALIAQQTARNGMHTEWAEEISSHYALTLGAWRERFNRAWPQLELFGYDERFKRLWNFYLAHCEAGFRERRLRDLQMVVAKPGSRRRPAFRSVPAQVSSGASSPGHAPVARANALREA